jgi:hypothetical protein
VCDLLGFSLSDERLASPPTRDSPRSCALVFLDGRLPGLSNLVHTSSLLASHLSGALVSCFQSARACAMTAVACR